MFLFEFLFQLYKNIIAKYLLKISSLGVNLANSFSIRNSRFNKFLLEETTNSSSKSVGSNLVLFQKSLQYQRSKLF